MNSWSTEVARAVEKGSLKSALKAAHQARLAGEEDASEIFEALRVVRDASRRVQRRPADAASHLYLAKGCFLADAGEAALREAEQALALDPQSVEAHALIGLEQCYRGNEALARVHYASARGGLPPDNPWLKSLAIHLGEAKETTDDGPRPSIFHRLLAAVRGESR